MENKNKKTPETKKKKAPETKKKETTETKNKKTSETKKKETPETKNKKTSEIKNKKTTETKNKKTTETKKKETPEIKNKKTAETKNKKTSETKIKKTTETKNKKTAETKIKKTTETKNKKTSEIKNKRITEIKKKEIIENKKENSVKKKKMLSILLTLVSIIILIGTTYAVITEVLIGNKKVALKAGVLDLVLEEDETIAISDAFPMYDQVGMIQEDVYEFRLINKTDNDVNYVLKLQDVETGTLSKSYVKYGLIKNGITSISFLSDLTDDVIDQGTIDGNQTNNYELRLWISDTVEDESKVANKFLKLKLNVTASEKVIYQDKSGANIPKLTSGMIPVTYDEEKKTWIKADITEPWYDYEEQMWANAVTVSKETRETYMAADAGEPISMDDINTMWVWIPRYEYNYLNLGPFIASGDIATGDIATGDIATGDISSSEVFGSEIKINFISSDTTRPSNSNTHRIPEGFKFGKENISGFWMGKFETSILEGCNEYYINCNLTIYTPQIKPNVTSWVGASISTFFESSRLMQSSDDNLNYNADTYGFDTIGTSSMDTHMLKNTEWGIVAMLSNSKYGKYGNPNYLLANKEVYQNQSQNYMTGMSSGRPSSSEHAEKMVTYDTPDTGYGASTTGTIYGVYDMSGGSYEYVMGNSNNISGASSESNSGFCGTNGPTTDCREWPDPKYYDLYTSDNVTVAYKFGDAVAETAGFYNDAGKFIGQNSPWFVRGGSSFSSNAGVFFYYNHLYGAPSHEAGSRLAIKP